MLWLKRLQSELIGSVFETSLFAELAKQTRVDNINFWRTTDKKEIDFVLKRPEGPLPIEAKNHFPHAIPPVFKSFWQTETPDQDTPCRVIGLYGEPTDPQMIFPWQLDS